MGMMVVGKIQFHSVGVVLFLCFFSMNSESLSYQKTVIRPSFEKIYSLMVKEGCIIKKEDREKLGLALRELDEIHCDFLVRYGYSFSSPVNLVALVKEKTAILPSKVPLCERAIVYSLYLQIEMLDLILRKKDQKTALFLEKKRKRKTVLSKNKKIFGDYRDVYLFLIIDLLGDISEILRCFGIESNINFNFPSGIRKNEVESYLSTKINQVSLQAKKLLYKK